jgi:Polyketide cyclase / dehydrase and lipid transport
LKTRVIQDDAEPAESRIDQAAAVVATSDTEIAAAPAVVWGVLVGIAEWPSWNPDVKSVSVDGGLSQGTTFRWKAGPGTITSTLQHVEAPRRIAWTGSTLGIEAMHVYVLEARDGVTLVRTEESYDGLVARVFRGRLQKTLEGALASGLRHLKTEAERRATHLAAEKRS